MDGCQYSLEIIIVPQKERTVETNFFRNKHAIAEKKAQTMDDRKISRQNKYSIL